MDMPCAELPACPICLEVPELPRVPECGHAFCLTCALRHVQQAARSCPLCGVGPVRFEDLRPVCFQVVIPPRAGEEEAWHFQLIRRVGDCHIGLPEAPRPRDPSSLPNEGDQGWRFARRVNGDPQERLHALHQELRALEAPNAASDADLPKAVLEPVIERLRQQVFEAEAAAAAAEAQEAGASARRSGEGASATVVFYQSCDGQLIFLEPWLTKQLLATYGSWGRLPQRLCVRPVHAVREEPITPEMQRRHRFLAHLPGGEATFVDGGVEVVEGEHHPGTSVQRDPKGRGKGGRGKRGRGGKAQQRKEQEGVESAAADTVLPSSTGKLATATEHSCADKGADEPEDAWGSDHE